MRLAFCGLLSNPWGEHSFGSISLLSLLENREVMIGKTSCGMAVLVGAPFGAVLEVDGNKLVRVDGELVQADEEPPGKKKTQQKYTSYSNGDTPPASLRPKRSTLGGR